MNVTVVKSWYCGNYNLLTDLQNDLLLSLLDMLNVRLWNPLWVTTMSSTVQYSTWRQSSTYFPSVTQIFICTHSSFNMWAISLCDSCHRFMYSRQWRTHHAVTPLQLNSEMIISVFLLLHFLCVLMYSERSPIILFSSFICFPHVRISDENYTEIILFQGATYPRRAS